MNAGAVVGGLFEIKVPQTLVDNTAGTFTNKGTINKAGTGTATIGINNDLTDPKGTSQINGTQGILKFKKSAIHGNGPVNVASAAEIDFDSGLQQTGGAFTLNGTLAVTGDLLVSGGSLTASGSVQNGTTISVAANGDGSGGTFTQSNGTANLTFTAMTVANAATFSGGVFKMNGSNTLTAGTVDDASGGVFQMVGTNTVTAGTTTIDSGGTLTGVGGLIFNTATFTNNGLIDLRASNGSYLVGTMSVNGTGGANSASFTQNSGGTLDLGLASTSTYSSLIVNGTAGMYGLVAVTDINGFNASMGNQFWIIDANSLTLNCTNSLPGLGFGHWNDQVVYQNGEYEDQLRITM